MAEILELRPASTAGRAAGVAELVRAHGLTGLVKPASEHVTTPDGVGDRILPVRPELRGLLPAGGLRRGSTVAVTVGDPAAAGGPVSCGASSVLLALLAAASTAGSWCAVVGMPALGLAAAAEFGIALERLVLVPDPGPDWPTVVAAFLDGIDLVVVAPPGPVSAALCSRLAARTRQRGGVLIPYGPWSGADLVLETSGTDSWRGLGEGWGRLSRRSLMISRRGRGAAAHPGQITLWLPLGTVAPREATTPPPLRAVG